MRILTAEQVADVVFRLRDETLTQHALATLTATLAYRGRQLAAAFSRSPRPLHPLALGEALKDLRSAGMKPDQVDGVKFMLHKAIIHVYARHAKAALRMQ